MMIKFNNLNQEIPYQFLKEKYDEALNAGQRGIEVTLPLIPSTSVRAKIYTEGSAQYYRNLFLFQYELRHCCVEPSIL